MWQADEAQDQVLLAMPVVLGGGMHKVTKLPKADRAYQGYSAHITDAEARSAFEAKFGRQPDELIRTGGGVNVGPLRKEEAR